jgi:CheY-like chemotaxis protein
VSLRILFADDSVTAQNMGRKILTDAGYDVVAVSNGAAAVKKIAEQKPDIIILDLYMPGYSGLEVCEKVRGSMETLKTPVLITVGKLEPWKPEEANRVRADGVIVKPFEASDLLAIVKKFEERIGQQAPPLVRQTAAAPSAVEGPSEYPEPPILGTPPQPTVDVPDHMATASAFSDLLGADSPNSIAQLDGNQASPALEPPAYRVAASQHASIPEYELPASWRQQERDDDPEIEAAAVAAPIAAHRETYSDVAAPPVQAHPPQIPVYQEPQAPAVEKAPKIEIVPAASAPIGDVDILRDPELQESAAETTRATVADATEPGLIPTVHQEAEPVAPAEREAAELAPVESDYPAPISEPSRKHVNAVVPADEPAMPAPVEHTRGGLEGPESDFEARVAAAMAAYSHVPESPMGPQHSVEATQHPVASLAAEHVERAAVPERTPAASHYAHFAPESQSKFGGEALRAAEPEPVLPPVAPAAANAPAASATGDHDSLAAHIEAAVPAAAAAVAAETGSDHHTIAEAVHRVMERLKPELVEEIVRELKSKK